ncbi:MAG: LysR family transcriptional regulator [Rhodospirillales bacterium]
MSLTPAARFAWNLDWNLLRTFMVIVEEESITRAALRLGLKQPTVSNALRRMEDRLGRRLIDRKPNVFRVTAVGALLYEECVEIFGTVSRLPVLLRDIEEEVTGRISIALTTHVISPLFDEALSSFHRDHPKVRSTLTVNTSEASVKAVLQKQASFALCLVHKQDPRLRYEVMYREFFGFFCGPTHRLFGKRGLTLEDLRGERSVSFQTDQPDDSLRDVALLRARAGLDATIVGISPSLEEVRRMIVAGMGIGPLPLHIAEQERIGGDLWRLPPYEDPPEVNIWLVWNPTAKLNRAEARLLDLLRLKIAETPIEARTYRSRLALAARSEA